MATKPSTILIVDDEAVVRRVLSRMLAEEGYRVREARDGKEALEEIRADPPDLVLLDVEMPVMDGLAACRELRQSDLTRALPVIIVTSRTEAADELRGLHCGADDYVAKPFDADEIKARVARLLRRDHPSDS